jgi:hypothetical protein
VGALAADLAITGDAIIGAWAGGITGAGKAIGAGGACTTGAGRGAYDNGASAADIGAGMANLPAMAGSALLIGAAGTGAGLAVASATGRERGGAGGCGDNIIGGSA